MEANKITGSEKGEHNSNRTDYRSGTRERRFDTRLGTFNLQIPKFRNTGYVPFFMQNKQRSEEALISMVVEAYTNGVSTIKIKHLAESLGIENMSADEVKKASTPSPLHPENSSSSCRSASSPSSVFFCCYDNCFLKCTDEPAHILL